MKRILAIMLSLGVLLGSTPIYGEANTGKGEDGEVTTIVGNGTASQGSYTVEGPRNVDAYKGLVYFIDGTHQQAKLRVWNGKTNATLVNLVKDEVVARNDTSFVSTGLAVVDGEIFVSSIKELYQLKTSAKGKYLTKLDKVREYMNANGYDYIYRMEEYGKEMYFMLAHKSRGYGFVKYNTSTRKVSVVLNPKMYYTGPNNFYVDKDGILIAFQSGYVVFEQFFPRKSIDVVNTNTGSVTDAWTTKDGYLHYVLNEDRVKWKVYKRPRNASQERILVAGDRSGYNDGFLDQVEMDGATDFMWDGSGYIFADKGNHAIRKIWLDTAPTDIN